MSAPRLGQAFVSPATPEQAVEWVVVEVSQEPMQAVLVVPADTSPAVGSADVAVPASEAGAALTLRGRFGLWLRPGLLEPRLLTRTVPDEACRAAAAKYQAFLVGRSRGEVLERETDEDFEYRHWLAEEVAPAHRALAAAQASFVAGEAVGSAQPPRAASNRSPWLPALAASLGAVSLGLGLWSFWLSHRVEQLSGSFANFKIEDIDFGDPTRGAQTVDLPAGSERLALVLHLDPKITGYERFRLEVTDQGTGRKLKEFKDLLPVDKGQLAVALEAPAEPEATLELRLWGTVPGPEVELGSHKLTVRRPSQD